jgi:hypothetical protein
MHHVRAASLLLAIASSGCATVALERHVTTTVPRSGDPATDMEAVVRGALRAEFRILRVEADHLVLRRGHERRFVDVALRYAPGYIDVEYLRSGGYRAHDGRIHWRYYQLLAELQTAVQTELSVEYARWRPSNHVPVNMSASTTRVEVSATGTVTTTRTASLATRVPPGQTRYTVSAEGAPTATAAHKPE